MMTMWLNYVPAAVAVVILALMLIAMHLGTRFALAHDARTEEEIRRGTGAIEGALFALLGLMLAFAISGAGSRFVERRHLIVQEANAIGTAYLRLDVLPEAFQPGLRQAFREYVDARLRGFRLLPSSSAWVEFEAAQSLQSRIWDQAVEACRHAEHPTVMAFVLSPINDMIDVTSTREASLFSHPPVIIYVLAVALALTCSVLAGRSMASRRTNKKSYRIGFALIFAFTFMVVIDAEYPRAGIIQVDQFDELLAECRAGMEE